MVAMYLPDMTASSRVVIDRQLDPDNELGSILHEQGYDVAYAAGISDSDRQQEEVDVVVVDLMRAGEAGRLARLSEVQARYPKSGVIIVTDTTLTGTPVTAPAEHIVLTYLCHSVDFSLLAYLIGGVMCSKYGASFADKVAILEAKSKSLRQQHQYTWNVLTLTGDECRDQLNRLVSASEKVLSIIDGKPNIETDSAMRSVRQSAVSMRCVVNNYLTLAELVSHRLPVHPTLIDPVRDVLEPLLAGYTDLLNLRGQTCQFRNNRPNLLIWADKALLTNVYDNLIHDALLFGNPGGAIIFTVMERGNVDELSVWYNGHGLDSRCLESLGERLTYDADDTVRRNAEIGIYLASKIIEAHGGSLWAETQANSWMNFIFTLPKREAAIRERTNHTGDFCFNACQ